MFIQIKFSAIRTLKKILTGLLILICLVPFAGYVVLQFPQIQTSIAKKTVRSLQDKVNGEISIDRISIVFFNKVMAYNLCVTGEEGDTLCSFAKISVTASPGELLRGRILINRILLENGCFCFKREDSEFRHNIGRIFNFLPKPDSLKKPFKLPVFTVENLILNNISFGMENHAAPKEDPGPGCMNFTDLKVSEIRTRILRINYDGNALTGRIRNLQCREKSGYGIKLLSGNIRMDSTGAGIENLRLSDNYSDISAKYLSFGYSSGKDWQDFVNKIILGAHFVNSSLDFRSIGVFAPSMSGNSFRLTLDGEINGPVRYLNANNLHVKTGKNSSLSANISIKGLPDIRQTIFALKTTGISTNFQDIAAISGHFSKKGQKNSPLNGLPGDQFVFQGNVFGKISDLQADGALTSSFGDIGIKATFVNPPKAPDFEIKTSVNLKNVAAGRLIRNPNIGEISMTSDITAKIDKRSMLQKSFVHISSMQIGSAWFKGHNYRNIRIMGILENGFGDLRMISHDSGLTSILQAIVTFREDNGIDRLRLFMDIPYANLSEMNFASHEKKSLMSMRAKADLRFVDDQSILGSLIMDDIEYSDENGNYHVDSLEILSLLNGKRHIVSVESPILSASYIATDSPSNLMKRITGTVLNPCFPEAFPLKDTTGSAADSSYGDYTFRLQAHDLTPLCNIFMPGLSIAAGTKLDVSIDKHDIFDLEFNSDLITLNDNRIRHPSITLTNKTGKVSASVSSDLAYLGGAIISNSRIAAIENGEGMKLGISFNNADTTSLFLTSDISMARNEDNGLSLRLGLNKSRIKLRGYHWDIASSEFVIGKRNYEVKGFRLSNEKESLAAEGTVSENPGSELSVSLDNFDISLLNTFIKADLGISGIFSGDMVFSNFFSGLGAAITISGSKVALKHHQIDSLSIMSRWDQNRKRFNLLINNYRDGANPINATGYFIPERKLLNLNTHLAKLDMGFVSTFTDEFLSISSGSVSGDILVSGTMDNLMVTSDNFTIDSVVITPEYTQVPYTLNGNIELTDRAIILRNFTAADPNGSKADISGSLTHHSLKDFYLDANLNFSNLLVVNTTEQSLSNFYGKAYSSGIVSITGPFNDLFISAQVTTNDNTSVHIPLSSGSSATVTDLISYVSPEKDSTESIESFIPQKKEQKNDSNLQISAVASITPGAEVLIEMSKQYGEALRCIGSGNLEIDLSPSRKIMNLRGDYTITEGSYHLSLAGIQSRDFIINEGGTISFNGDMKNTNLNVGATYRTKASISTLIADTTSVGNRRTVDCGINLSGSLVNPQINFTIDIPDLDPITKGMVESALSTPDKVQKQLMSLLISGSFVPDQQSGIVNNSTLLYSNASEILANQFNNIFRQLDIPLDLGLNYQPGSSGGKDMFDVAISYQAFNNRLVINGNVGNSETSSNWAGDFEAEFKVDKRGKLRITVFTRSADSYSNYLDNTQRNGFGVTFQDEFDTFGDFWRNLFFTKKRKEEYELEQLRKAEEDLKREAEEANIKKETVLRPKENPMEMNISNQSIQYQSDSTVFNPRQLPRFSL